MSNETQQQPSLQAETQTDAEQNTEQPSSLPSDAPTPPAQLTDQEKNAAALDFLTADAPDADEGSPSDDPESSPGQPKPSATPPTTPREAAEALGIDPKDIYALNVPISDGEAVSISKLQDAYRDSQKAEAAIADRSADLDTREGKLTTDMLLAGRLQQEFSNLPQQAQRIVADFAAKEDARLKTDLMAVMPELADPLKQQEFGTQLNDLFKRYNVNPARTRFTDAGQYAMARDLMRAQAELERLKAYQPGKGKPKHKTPAGRNGGKQVVDVNKAAQGGNAGKNSAVLDLIKGA